jgi:molybdate transport system substrate-binding protein
MTVVTLFSGLAVQEPLERVVLPLFREQYGAEVETTFEPTTVLVDLLRSGRRPDVVIAVRETLADLVREGFVACESVNPLVRAGLGIAVRAGAHSPQVNTLPEFVSLLLSARSVAYSRAGASGIYFSGLLDRLGIGDQVNRTATVIPKGYTGECLLDGRADVAIQQLTELRFVPGIEVVGPFPPEVQHYTTFAAASLVTHGDHRGTEALASAMRATLSSREARAAYIEAGLEPVDAL